MKNKLRAAAAWLRSLFDGRDLAGLIGLLLLGYGGERLYPGAGFTAAGAILVSIAAFTR